MNLFGWVLINTDELESLRKKNKELIYNNTRYREVNAELQADNDRLAKLANGERACSKSCRYCEHNDEVIETTFEYSHMTGIQPRTKTEYRCLLDCNCPDFKQRPNPYA